MSVARVGLMYSLLLGLPFSATGGEVQPVNGGPLLLRPSPDQSGRYHFAIMGEVIHPGVYEQTEQNPLIGELLRKAGGPTNRAAHSARIIRQGRVLQQVFLSDDTTFRILPDDVVVVAARYASSRLPTFSAASHQFIGRSSENRSRSAPADVQIALVNLIERPVVLRVRGEYASVGAILSALGQKTLLKQDGAIPPGVRLIETGISRRFQQKQPTAGTRLASGSVLVFDPGSIEAATVPHHTLPKPFTDAPEGDTDLTSRQPVTAPPSHNGDKQADTHNGNKQFGDVRKDIAAPTPMKQPALFPGDGLKGDEFFGRPAIRPRIQYGSASRFHTDFLDNHQPHSRQQRRSTWDIPTDAGVATAAAKSAKKKTGGNSASNSILTPRGYVTLLVGVVGVLAAGSAFLVLWSMARGVPLPNENRAEAIAIIEPQPANILDALINNEIPIVEESLEMPMSLELHGRPAGGRKTRIDSAHSPSAPHTGFDVFKSDITHPNVVGGRRGLREEMNQRGTGKNEDDVAVESPSEAVMDLDSYFDSESESVFESDPDIDLDVQLLKEADEHQPPRSEAPAEPSVYRIQPPTNSAEASPLLSIGVPTALAGTGPHLSVFGERRQPKAPAAADEGDDQQDSNQQDSKPSITDQTQDQTEDQTPGRHSHDLLDRVLSSVQRCMQRAVAS